MSPGAKIFRALRDQAREDARQIALWQARAEMAVIAAVAIGVVLPTVMGFLSRLPG